jgi:hypothetical protein
MSAHASEFAVDEALERAYRLALGLHGLANDKVCVAGDPAATDLSLWVMASELLRVLDEARAMRVRRTADHEVPH